MNECPSLLDSSSKKRDHSKNLQCIYNTTYIFLLETFLPKIFGYNLIMQRARLQAQKGDKNSPNQCREVLWQLSPRGGGGKASMARPLREELSFAASRTYTEFSRIKASYENIQNILIGLFCLFVKLNLRILNLQYPLRSIASIKPSQSIVQSIWSISFKRF